MAIYDPFRHTGCFNFAGTAQARGGASLGRCFIDLLVAATESCREVGVLWKAIDDVGVATWVKDVHSGCERCPNLAVGAMIGCDEHVIVDRLVVEMMQVRIHFRAAYLAREAFFLPSSVADKIGLALAHLDSVRVKPSQSGI